MKLKAISVRQPFAWLIVNGIKDIENRKWATKVRGPVLVHAGAKKESQEHLDSFFDAWPEAKLEYGGIVGVVEIADCIQKHKSRWFRGKYGWLMQKAQRLPFRPCPGKLKFFVPDVK